MFNYISILAGGKCSFKCSFCVGNEIRKNEPAHFAPNWKKFLKDYATKTSLLSISGDTSDPIFIKDTWNIPEYAKNINNNLRITLHTRKPVSFEEELLNIFNVGYDKLVLSIDK